MTIGLIATLTVQDGAAEEFTAVMTELRAAVLANEPGCKQYDMFTQIGDPNTFVMMEQYEDQAALDAHGKSAHFAAAQPKMGALLAGAPDLKLLTSA